VTRESVAWVAEQRGLLAAVFSLLTVALFLQAFSARRGVPSESSVLT
jgi:hypothetical protein